MHELDTPALCIDLAAMDRNIERMAEYCAHHGKQWRPHCKCHKTPAIAHRQLRAGAIGVTCAKVGEAETMIHNGIADVLIANMIVGESKWRRVASLARHGRPIVACDHFIQAEGLARACQAAGSRCRVIVEVDVGLNRVGVQPGRDTVELARAIDALPNLEFAGIMGYEGQWLQEPDLDRKTAGIADCMRTLGRCREMLLDAGLSCPIVSAGGTGSYQITATCPEVTELQCGGGIFADPLYQEKCHLRGLEFSLSVLTTVVSRPTRTRAVLDAGRKTHFPDFVPPRLKYFPEATVLQTSAEHCVIELAGAARELRIGDKIELIPGYADFTTVLHDLFFGIRKGRVETVWPIAARGALQ
ncbi:MAG: DSD1 family PLP-dependent enzyme [Planctomycetota bacterium]|nr:MAG: DSD1 family PLP-dependent enzyme [Planctomycetota bacterium]